MIILLTIFQYFLQTVVDVMDKFLITKRKIEPVGYTFYTIVTGLALLLVWPWVYHPLDGQHILLNLLSGAWFSLSLFVFYLALKEGEVSRVVPFVYGLVPAVAALALVIVGRNPLSAGEAAAMILLIAGALLMTQRGKFWSKHVGTKFVAAAVIGTYGVLWQYAASENYVLNDLMWNRLGAALVLVIPMVFPHYRSLVLHPKSVEKHKNTAFWFLFKQVLGGGTFIFLSYLLAKGSVPIVYSLQGFRYVFLFALAVFLTRKYRHILEEKVSRKIIQQKVWGVAFIFAGTMILFLIA